jgi:voltage-gated potassium channel
MDDHVIILGWDGFSERVFRELNRSNIPVAIATVDHADAVRDRYGDLEGVEVVEMSSFEAIGRLAEVDASEAVQFFVNLETDDDKLLRVVDLAERDEWDGEIDVVLENEQLEETFRDAGVRYAVSRDAVSSKLLATHVYEPDVAAAAEQLFTSTKSGTVDGSSSGGGRASDASRDAGIQQLEIGADFELPDVEPVEPGTYVYRHVVKELRRRFGALPLAIYADGEFERLPGGEARVGVGDYLLVALTREVEREVREFLDATGEGRLADSDG